MATDFIGLKNLNTNINNSSSFIDFKKDTVETTENKVKYYVIFSFNITYVFLLTTATITFIEAMRTKVPTIRHILNLETAISVIAGYFYLKFLEKIQVSEQNNTAIDWEELSVTRYIDWSMTTPLMLLGLCLFLSRNVNKMVTLKVIAGVVILNYAMLYFGYLGEAKHLDRVYSLILGFLSFFGLFYLIFINYVGPKYVKTNYILFTVFTIVWSLYGVAFMFNDEYKNIAMNILDCISKCFIGIGFWLYFSKIVVF
jgi:bacteriorhodopsin